VVDPFLGTGSPGSIQQGGLALRHWPRWLQQQSDPALQPQRLLAHLRQEIPWQQPVIRVYGRMHPIPRQSCWIGDPGCQYRYSGLLQTPEPWSAPLLALRHLLEGSLACGFNSLLLNRYRDGLDRMGWHADDEPELVADQPIASLSLGVSRSLRFRPKPAHAGPGAGSPFSLELADGDLLVMDAPTQKHWLHALPERRRVAGERINLTFRQIQTA
jgi:alkylated DNA repair dioxygenase AlkB